MTAKNLNELNAIVRFRGDYQNKIKFSDSDVNGEIQTAFQKFWQIVDDTNEGWCVIEDTVTTTSGTQFVGLPEDCWRVRGIDILISGEYEKLDRIGLESRNAYGADTDQPEAYRLSFRGIELYPTPDAAYTLRVTYSPFAPSLAAALRREWFNGWDDYVINCALVELHRREGDPRLNDRIAAMDRAAAVVQSGAAKRDSTGVEYLPLPDGPDDLSLAERGIFR